MIRVQLVYEPALYREVLAQVLEQTGSVEVVADPAAAVDVVIFRRNCDGLPQEEVMGAVPPDAKLVGVSPSGDQGLVRLPGESEWRIIRPFGLPQLILEALAGRGRRADCISTLSEVDEIPH